MKILGDIEKKTNVRIEDGVGREEEEGRESEETRENFA